MQRHLAAFESALELVARARLRALVAASGLRALAGAVTAADALLRVLRRPSDGLRLIRSMTLLLHRDEVADLVDHAARLPGVSANSTVWLRRRSPSPITVVVLRRG